MASYYVNLPAPRMPRNAMLDFSGVNNAIDSYQAQQNRERQFGMQEQQLAMQKDQQQYQRGRDAKQDARQSRMDRLAIGKALAERASALAMLPPDQQGPAWNTLLSEHKRFFPDDPLEPADLDPRTGPARYAAAFGGIARDPLDRDIKQAQLAHTRAQTSALGRKDAMSEFILRQLGGGGAPAPQAPQPGVQPQSYNSAPGNAMLQNASAPGGPMPQPMPQDQNANPYLIQTQAAPAAPAPAAPQERVVQTPYGPKTESEARRLGGAMLLDPRFATAGKAILDSLGPANPDALGKEGRNEIEKKMIAASDNLTNLASIRLQFKPEFQQVENRFGMTWKAFADKFKAGQQFVTPEDRKALADYAAFRSDAFDGFNAYIKSITGAAMTQSEAERIMKAFPAPGEGLFDGDSPTEFKAKLDQAYEKAKAAVARYNFARNNGKDWQYIGLNQMADIVRKRGNAIQDEIRKANPSLDPAALQGEVRSRLKQEFGI